ncbi:Sec-independent protein translocase protein TatC [Alphaproteobacteria bacterium]
MMLKSKRKKNTQREVLPKASLHSHYREFRARALVCILSFILTTTLAFIYIAPINDFLVRPLFIALNQRQDVILDHNIARRFIFTGLTEGFFTNMKLAFFVGFILSFPVIVSQIYFFVAKGLYKHEQKMLLPHVIFSQLLFIVGAAVAYFFVMPLAWKFFLSFEGHVTNQGTSGYYKMLPIVLEAKISEYLNTVIELIVGFGVAFQLPTILALLNRLGVVSRGALVKFRRYAIVLIFVAAAVLTPPDVISQITLAVPMLLLYELSILICVRKNE